jgi:undecaprenyl-diphosphatase
VVVALGALAAFAWLAAVPAVGSGHAWDRSVQDAVHGLWSDAATQLFIVVARVGGGPGLGVLAGVAALVLAARGRRRTAAVLVLGLVWSELLSITLKTAFARPRPELWESPLPALGWSFPSGHAMTSSTLAVLAVALLWHTRWRLHALAVAVPCVLLVGLCRVYLGVHYPSDVLAGWCVTAIWTATALAVSRWSGVRIAEDAPAR